MKDSEDGKPDTLEAGKRVVRSTLERLRAERAELDAKKRQIEAQFADKQRKLDQEIRSQERSDDKRRRLENDRATRQLHQELGKRLLELMLTRDPEKEFFYFDDFQNLSPAMQAHLDVTLAPWREILEATQGLR